MFRLTAGIRRRLLLKMLVTFVFVFLLFGFSGVLIFDHIERRSHLPDLYNRVSRMVSTVVSNLEHFSDEHFSDQKSRNDSVLSQMEDILEGFSGEHAIECAELADQNNLIVILRWPAPDSCSDVFGKTKLSIALTPPSTLQLNVVVSERYLDQELKEQTLHRIYLLLGSILLVTATLVLAYRFWLQRPMNALLRAMDEERENGSHRLLDYPADDEMGSLITEFNTLMATLEQRDIALTEYKQALNTAYQRLETRAEQLARSEALFVAAFDSAPVGVALRSADPDNPRFLRVNEQFCSMLGYSAEELLSMNVWNITPASELQEAKQYIGFLGTGAIGPYTREKRYIRKDGTELWASISVAPVLDDDKKLLHFVAIVIDISAEKRARAERDSARRLMQDLLDYMPAEVAVIDSNRHFQIRNNSHRQNHSDVSDLDEVKITATDSLALMSGQALQQEEVDELPGQEKKFFLAQRFPLKNELGQRYGYGLIRTDISQLKHAEMQLRQTEAWYREIFELAPEGMLIIDDEGRVHLGNDGVQELLGYNRKELQGMTVADLVPAHFREEQGRNLRAFLLAPPDTLLKREVMALHKAGDVFPVEIKLRRLPKLPERPQFISVAVRSLVAQREMQKITREARKLAEQAARTKSDFLANMSHEIRTPLNAIIGLSRLAMDQAANARQRDQLSKVLVSARHLLGIVGDILDVSKIEAGKLQLEEIEFAIDKVLADSAVMVAQQCSAKGLELILNVDPAIPRRVLGDPLRLSQVIANYTNNALKFTDHGEIEIVAELLRREGSEVLIKLSVRDTGIGMTREQISRLFQSFHQADPSISRRYGGTGLGLAICKRFAVMMGGEVGVDSEIGRGSSFWFTARLRVPEQAAATAHKANPEGRRVLVVDDNPTVRRVLQQMLKGFGLIVEEARTGLEAVERCLAADREGCAYDIALVDLMMAGIDGVETIKRLHAQLPRRPRLVAVSGFMSGPLHKQAELAGAERILQKPLQPSVLLETITDLVEPGHQTAPGAARDEARADKPRQLFGVSVLLVEDNQLNQEVAAAFLEDWGCKVMVASDGAQALHMAQEYSFDLVLMDMQMPLMDGLEATRAIRAIERLRGLPIVAMTANAMPRDRERCLEAGMNEHVTKPIDPERLLGVILQQLSRAPVSAPEGRAAATPQSVIDIAGIDTVTGLNRVLQNTELYQSMLRRFADQATASFVTESQQALDCQDRKTLERLAHTLKSTAALVGADAVSDAAGELEAAAQTGDSVEELRGMTRKTAGLASTAATDIRAWLEMHTSVALEIEPHGGGGAQLVEQLREYLTQDDARALRLCRENSKMLSALLGPRAVLLDSVERFDFAGALALLDGAATAAGQARENAEKDNEESRQ